VIILLFHFSSELVVIVCMDVVHMRDRQVEKEANALKERLSSLETEMAQLSAKQQEATDNLEQMAKSADVCDR